MKNLLAGEQQAAVTVAMEALMDAKPEAEAFATFDPKVGLKPGHFVGDALLRQTCRRAP